MKETLRVFSAFVVMCFCILMLLHELKIPFIIQEYFMSVGLPPIGIQQASLEEFPFAQFITDDPRTRGVGLALLVAGSALFVLSWFVLTVVAFGELPTWGVACVLSPPIAFVFGILHEEKTRLYLVMHFVAFSTLLTGLACLYLPR